MNLIFTLLKVSFMAGVVLVEMAFEWFYCAFVARARAYHSVRSQNLHYGAPRPKLARYLPGLARLCNVVKEAVIMFTNNSLFNSRSFKPVSRD